MVKITLFKWAGSWGPFKIKIPCGECTITKDVIQDTLKSELAGVPVEFEVREWLSEWWKPLIKGGWHAPIVMVDGSVLSQGVALNRGVFTEAVIKSHCVTSRVTGTHLFGKEGCPHCKRAKELLQEAEIEYRYHNIISSPRALYEMMARVKPLIDAKTPVTVPQIWVDGEYVGGADALSRRIKTEQPEKAAKTA